MSKTTLKTARKLWEELRTKRDARGVAMLAPKDIARMLRERLRVEFPGVKFGVRTTCSTGSIRISWEDGPYRQEVERIANGYNFGGFDGSIDLAYSCRNWLHPDGTMSFGGMSGTAGSGGYVSGAYTDCPEPGAILVDSWAKYIFCERERSEAATAALARETCEYWGIEYQPDLKPWDHPVPEGHRHSGVWNLSDLMRRLEGDKARELVAALEQLN